MLIDYSYIFDKARDLYAYLSYNNKSGKAIQPLRYFFDVTYRCMLKCSYCYLGDERNKDELSTEDWLNIIKQIPKYGVISIIGGEPLIREDFPEILRASSERVGGKVNLYSNGLLLNERIAEEFIKSKLLCLSVSLDGLRENHDANRNYKGLFDKVVNNLDLLIEKSHNKHHVIIDVKTVLLENNLDDIPKLYEFCNKKGFEFLSIAFKRNNYLKQHPYLRPQLTEEFYLQEYPLEPYFDMEHFKVIYKELEKMSKKFKTHLRWAPKFKPTGDIERIEKFFNSGNEKVSNIYRPCLFPFSNIFINPEGHVYPCLSVDMGSLKEKKLMEIFNQPQYKCFRKNIKAAMVLNGCQLCCELYPKNKE